MANLVRWDPFGEALSLRQAVDRLFEDAWVRPWLGHATDGVAAPPIDMYETGEDLVVTASLPGVKPEDVEITVQGEVLTIRGEARDDETVSQEAYHRRERKYGRFTRQLALPTPVDSTKAEAHFEHGVLKLRLPKMEQAKERRIQITSASTNSH
ncbi:MAG TPA: Hsp20/alpha crystallin family protein [Chloroflexota bacterium]|nr:Hsp20/alpha crystallin family protein [Chloroflexota bacterium]